MAGLFLLNALLGALPVLVFLATLEQFDSFRLVRFRTILMALAAGAAAACAAYYINTSLSARYTLTFPQYAHLASPLLEEGMKALIIIALIRTNRIGFVFDAVVLGFAIGAGFALVENLYFLRELGLHHPAVWTIRGFGTAIMHGGAAAIMGATAHLLTLRTANAPILRFAPGYALAVALHAGFNFFLGYPVSSTIAMLFLLAGACALSLWRDQKSIHDWIKTDFEHHRKLLKAVESGRYDESRIGRLLRALHVRADEQTIADCLAYIKAHTELVLKAEEVLLAHERGEKPVIDEATKENLRALGTLEIKLGHSARLVLAKHLHFSRHEFWELYMLEKEAGFQHPHAHGV